jgi:hypothetical protein
MSPVGADDPSLGCFAPAVRPGRAGSSEGQNFQRIHLEATTGIETGVDGFAARPDGQFSAPERRERP